jgi:glycosyltransferase involved in cell wall biosynthesis
VKVLLVHNRYRSSSPSGEDRVVDQEGDALVAAGHTVERFERSSDEIARRSAAGKALVPIQMLWNDEVRRSLTRALRSYRPDVVHIHNTFPLVSASVLYACRAERIPVVATLHNYRLVCPSGTLFRDGRVCHDCVGRLPLPGIRHGCYRDSVLATVPMATGVVAHRTAWRTMVSAYVFISRAQRDIMASDGLPAARLFVKPNFVPWVVPASAAPEDRIVYAGRLTEEKGLPLLMEAWDRYADGPDEGRLGLSVAGAGPLESTVAAWAAARPSVQWLGRLSREECASLVAGARAVVLPSQWEETFGLVAVEAMAAGLPSVVPAHGSFPELITDGLDGVLFEPGDPSSLAAVIRDVQARPEHYEGLGRVARRTYEKRFSPAVNMEELLQIYEFAVRNRVSTDANTPVV